MNHANGLITLTILLSFARKQHKNSLPSSSSSWSLTMAPLAPIGYVNAGGSSSSLHTIVFSEPQMAIPPTPYLLNENDNEWKMRKRSQTKIQTTQQLTCQFLEDREGLHDYHQNVA